MQGRVWVAARGSEIPDNRREVISMFTLVYRRPGLEGHEERIHVLVDSLHHDLGGDVAEAVVTYWAQEPGDRGGLLPLDRETRESIRMAISRWRQFSPM